MGAGVKIKAIVEAAVYVDDLQATEAFYRTVLGLAVIGKGPGRYVFFQVSEEADRIEDLGLTDRRQRQ
jgi:catechol 2,3-dioxygenase-like lactoylglutathione lyase family enzyme